MDKVVVSLLKGGNNNKKQLLDEKLPISKLISFCKSDDLKNNFNLEIGYNFVNVDSIISMVDKLRLDVVTIDDLDYPVKLKEIYDPPYLLYVRGNKKALNSNIVSVVGTRKPSLSGYHGAFKVGLDLGKNSIGVVSGLALGIDSAAQKGNVSTGGKSIAVMGCGVDNIYPKANRELAGDILRTNGAIISEFAPGEEPKRFNFPKRNRIIAGLSSSLVIIQAPKGSGSLITGNLALESGRDIYIHSVGIDDTRFLGSDKFYKDGGKRIDSVLPILKNYGKDLFIEDFDYSTLKSDDLISLELSGRIIKYKGCYFKK